LLAAIADIEGRMKNEKGKRKKALVIVAREGRSNLWQGFQ
jgi:hypothetical protein